MKLKVFCSLLFIGVATFVFGYSGGTGTESEPYLIANKADLLELGATIGDYDKHFLMTSDIDLSGTNFSKAVITEVSFSGCFDGNNKTISNLSIGGGSVTNSSLGLFKFIHADGVVKNLSVVDCFITGRNYVGGLCGINRGIISNCFAGGIINGVENVGGLCGQNLEYISGSSSTGTVSGHSYVGGLCGVNDDATFWSSFITNCFSSASVVGDSESEFVGGLCGDNNNGLISFCYSTGSVVGYRCVGGLIGIGGWAEFSYSSADVSLCNGGTVIGGFIGFCLREIVECYSSGTVSGYVGIGGFVGLNYAYIHDCYSTSIIEGDGYYATGGFCGVNDSWGSILRCYAAGSIHNNGITTFVGTYDGIGADDGTVDSCFFDFEIAHEPNWYYDPSYVESCNTTLEMQTQSTFSDAGWDFVNTWIMDGYPALKRFYTSQEIYELWGENYNVPTNEFGYGDCPSNDGIQNLLKYAIGLNPMQTCSAEDVLAALNGDETNAFSVTYKKAKGREDILLFPTWTDSLIITNWNKNGFEYTLLSETASNETWKATLPMTNDCGYIRLNAKTTD
ncbi:MAG: hypothetical protein PF692_09015 [Kiritimatiellae bacterium]|nr:hypothetical protein [Kiritimatiellia bacterium]